MTRKRVNRRRGTVLVVVLITMAVCLLLLGQLTRRAAWHEATQHGFDRRLQADWLAESAIERAAWRLRQNADYGGERWEVSADALGKRDGGVVVIEVGEVSDRPDRRRVRVGADFPRDDEHRVRRSLEVELSTRSED